MVDLSHLIPFIPVIAGGLLGVFAVKLFSKPQMSPRYEKLKRRAERQRIDLMNARKAVHRMNDRCKALEDIAVQLTNASAEAQNELVKVNEYMNRIDYVVTLLAKAHQAAVQKIEEFNAKLPKS